MKVYPLLRKTIVMLIVSVLVAGALVFGMCFNLFIYQEWTWVQPFIIGVYIISSIVLFILTPRSIYYEVNRKYVTVVKYRKELVYNYSDVVYINEELSEKKKTICFYTNKGHVRYLAFDREGLLYKTMLANCKSRISKEEFEATYPNIKF